MDYDLFSNITSGSVLVLIIVAYYYYSKRADMGALSMPCIAIMTSFLYFYIMPFVTLGGYDPGFVGLFINSLEWVHLAALLYLSGALLACSAFSTVLRHDISRRSIDHSLDVGAYRLTWLVCILVVFYLAATGKVNVFGAENYQLSDWEGVKFLNNFYNLLVPLTIMFAVRNNFRVLSLIVVLAAAGLLLQVGFRYRLLILLAGTVSSYALVRGWRVGLLPTAAGTVAAVFFVNFVGAIRQYGRGVDLSRLGDTSFGTILGSFSGEIGPVYVFANIANRPLPGAVTIEPWLVGISRLVPSALWPDKPTASYLSYFSSASIVENADRAGLAAPQHVEILLQFGWFALPVLAFLYFGLAAKILNMTRRLSFEARVAGFAMAPAFFGYYMQTRGYFFQILSDGIFIFTPLFLMHIRKSSPIGRTRQLASMPLQSRNDVPK